MLPTAAALMASKTPIVYRLSGKKALAQQTWLDLGHLAAFAQSATNYLAEWRLLLLPPLALVSSCRRPLAHP